MHAHSFYLKTILPFSFLFSIKGKAQQQQSSGSKRKAQQQQSSGSKRAHTAESKPQPGSSKSERVPGGGRQQSNGQPGEEVPGGVL
eukprot:gene16603-22845_t